MSALSQHLRALSDAATVYDPAGERDEYVNQWRVFKAVDSERGSRWGVATGRADWPRDVIAATARLRKEDAELIVALHSNRDALIAALEAVEAAKESSSDTDGAARG